eukprot:a3618_15.p1 GENE.a3618_15~~a3618_15.p1  ORF type:complete len:242 (+),score=58.99 a3618_15:63-728(+)
MSFTAAPAVEGAPPLLPLDLWAYVFRFCSFKSVVNASQTCKAFHKMLQAPKFYRNIDLSDEKTVVVDESLQRIAPRLAAASRLSLLGCRRLTAAGITRVAPLLSSSLQVLDLGGLWNVDDACLAAFVRVLPELVELRLGGCIALSDASLNLLATHCGTKLSVLSLRFLRVSEAAVFETLRSLLALSLLDLGFVEWASPAAKLSIRQSFPTLHVEITAPIHS